MKKIYFIAFLLCAVVSSGIAQKNKADSIRLLLDKAQTDTDRVKYRWLLADASSVYSTDSALFLAKQALALARQIKYLEGESRSLGIIANVFIKMGNYPKALEIYLQKLKIEEQRNMPRNMASVIVNIGIVYTYQEEYNNALLYYYRADSIVRAYNLEDVKYNIALNLGDVYDRLNVQDSAFMYFQRSLDIASGRQEKDLIGASMVGLGHSYFKSANYPLAKQYYTDAISNLAAVADEDLMCEAGIGLAKLYGEQGQRDSAEWYAMFSLNLARKDGFQSRELDAVNFLTKHYSKWNKTDSAFTYLLAAQGLKDSINSKERVRQSQVLSSNESLRQLELAESKKIAAEERSQQLQLLFIGIFIPALFVITLFLSRIKVNVRVIRSAGIISLLILFEYLTILLHPRVVELAHHTPVIELFIFVLIAALVLPAHHRMEHWLIHVLTMRNQLKEGLFKIQTSKLKIKKPL